MGDTDHHGGTSDVVVAFAGMVAERNEDRRHARAMHRRRFVVQLAGWGAKILLAAAAFPLLLTYSKFYLAMCNRASFGSVGCGVSTLLFFTPPLALAILLGGNWLWHFLRHHAWEVAMGQAQQFTNRENVARGYTELFSIYVRTKRRSYHLTAWALVALVYAFEGIVLGASNVATPAGGHLVYWLPEALSVVIGLALLFLSYLVGSTYLPGDVIVRHTLALIIYAVSNLTDPNLARRQAASEADQFVRTNPWWFYAG